MLPIHVSVACGSIHKSLYIFPTQLDLKIFMWTEEQAQEEDVHWDTTSIPCY